MPNVTPARFETEDERAAVLADVDAELVDVLWALDRSGHAGVHAAAVLVDVDAGLVDVLWALEVQGA